MRLNPPETENRLHGNARVLLTNDFSAHNRVGSTSVEVAETLNLDPQDHMLVKANKVDSMMHAFH